MTFNLYTLNKDNEINYYYERNCFIINSDTYVDMVCLTYDILVTEKSYKKKKYNTLVSYSKEVPINTLTPSKKKDLLNQKRIELIYKLTVDEYKLFSNMNNNELFNIDPTNIASNNYSQ